MSAINFKDEFKKNMASLEKIKTDVETKITEKTTFSKTVMTELQKINSRLTDVRSKLTTLKSRLVDLEGKIKEKETGIADAGTACTGLQEEIQRLKDALERSQDEQRRFKEDSDAKQEENKRQIQQLEKQLVDEKARYGGLIRENEELKQDHVALSNKIDEITQKIATLSSADTTTPEDVTRLLEQIKDILNNLEKDVSSSASSSTSASGSTSGSETVGEAVGKPLATILRTWSQPALERVVFNGKTFRELLQILYGKPARSGSDESKFLKAFDFLVKMTDKDINSTIIGSIFSPAQFDIKLNVDDLEGGKKSRKPKKTRKTKKIKRRRRQKGGYTYSDKTKRRTFSSSPRTSSSSSRRSSSPTSSQNDRPKRKSRKTL
jgi:myosin heavy subunit